MIIAQWKLFYHLIISTKWILSSIISRKIENLKPRRKLEKNNWVPMCVMQEYKLSGIEKNEEKKEIRNE